MPSPRWWGTTSSYYHTLSRVLHRSCHAGGANACFLNNLTKKRAPLFLHGPMLRPGLTSRMALEDSAPGRSCLLAKMSRVAPARRWGRQTGVGRGGSEGSPAPPLITQSRWGQRSIWKIRARPQGGRRAPSGVGGVDVACESSHTWGQGEGGSPRRGPREHLSPPCLSFFLHKWGGGDG